MYPKHLNKSAYEKIDVLAIFLFLPPTHFVPQV
jgi:hypothetical protein